MSHNEKSVIVANLTWNPTGWRGLYTNSHAGHKYARSHPGHESLNFKFDKAIDTKDRIHGYVQWTNPPKEFNKGGIVLFHSNNLDQDRGEFVGIYCDAVILDPPIVARYKGFQNNELSSNLRADRHLSMLFPIPLETKRFGKGKFDPQVGFTYKDADLVSAVIEAEIDQLKRSNLKIDEYTKLLSIYAFATGKKYDVKSQSDEEEQEELIAHFTGANLDEIMNDLSSITQSTPEEVTVRQKTYKRNNKSIALLKVLHDFKCQICSSAIRIRNRKYYVEAAHIVSKSRKGLELPKNILILCPNHHKEFDLGERRILEHDHEHVRFEMNGVEYSLPLSPRTRRKGQ